MRGEDVNIYIGNWRKNLFYLLKFREKILEIRFLNI